MALTLKDMLQEAHAAVPRISAQDAKTQLDAGALLVDLRDGAELAASGKAKGSVHISRGLLEFRADPDSPLADPELRKDRTIILHCASGGVRRWRVSC